MKRFNKTIAMFMAGLMVVSSATFVACDEDDYSTSQFKGGVSLTAAQLQVTRGGYMTFKGSGLDKVESIIFPGDVVVTEIEVVDQYTIRCIVPEAAEPGVVQLVSGDIVLETKEIAFTEPITFTSFAPAAVKAGDVLTIKGTYLNLITHVKFATGEYVPVEGTRYEIKVTVPVDASTGVVAVAQETIVDEEATYNEIPAEGELTVAEPEATLSAKVVKPGQELTISGSLLRLVKSVTFQGAKAIEVAQEDPTKEVASIKVEVPATTVAGAVTMELLSGIEVSAGEISIAETTVAIADKKDSYGVDDEVVLTGANLDLVSKLAFAGTDAVDVAASATGDTISVKVPAAAQSGNITLTTLNGSTVEVEGFVTTKPAFTSFAADVVPLGNDVVINGERLTLVTKVEFTGGATVEVKPASDTELTVKMPTSNVSDGVLTLYMVNGETVKTSELKIDLPIFCYVVEWPEFGEEDEVQGVKAGNIMTVTVANTDLLTSVFVDGEECQFILNGDKLYINVPQMAGASSEITLVSSNGQISYPYAFIPATSVEIVAWKGMTSISWSDPDKVHIPVTAFQDVPAGALITFYFSDIDGAWAQAQLYTGDYTAIAFDEIAAVGSQAPTFVPSDHAELNWWGVKNTAREISFVLTQEILDLILAHSNEGDGFVIQGQNLIFSKVTISYERSFKQSIVLKEGTEAGGWTLPVALSWGDGGRLVVYKNNPIDLSSKVKVGATMYIVTTNRHGQCQINDNTWISIETVADWSNEGEHTFEVPITQAYVDAFNKPGDVWLYIQGDSGFTIKDILIE